MKVELIHDKAVMPTRATPNSAGFDLSTIEGRTLAPGERALLRTGLKIELPQGTYLRIAPRSGLALKYGIDVLAGVVDADYRGEVGVLLINLGTLSFSCYPGDRIAQGIIERCSPAFITTGAPDETIRGAGGFGSTGV